VVSDPSPPLGFEPREDFLRQLGFWLPGH